MKNNALIANIKHYGVLWAPQDEEFTLASGAKSKFYIDFSKIIMVPKAARVVYNYLLFTLFHYGYEKFDLVGGPSSGIDPIVGSLIPAFADSNDIRGFTIRKEPKGRGPGAGEMFEGYLEKGKRAVVIEDVTTSGNSVLKAIKVVESQGVKVVKVVSILDRQAGAKDLLKDYDFTALVTLEELKLEI